MPTDSGPPFEFRENSRAPLHAPATLQIDTFSDPLSGFTGDISMGGMFVRMTDPPPVGTVLRFTIELEEPPGEVKGMAEVVWLQAHALTSVKPAGIGVQFRFIEASGEMLLRQAVASALGNAPPDPEPPPGRRAPARSRPQAPPRQERPAPVTPASKLHERGAAERDSPRREGRATPASKAGAYRTKVILLVLLFLVMIWLVLRGLG